MLMCDGIIRDYNNQCWHTGPYFMPKCLCRPKWELVLIRSLFWNSSSYSLKMKSPHFKGRHLLARLASPRHLLARVASPDIYFKSYDWIISFYLNASCTIYALLCEINISSHPDEGWTITLSQLTHLLCCSKTLVN